MHRTLAGTALMAAGLMIASSAPAFGASTGSGATFPALVYRDWCQASNLCSYTPKGSTGGIRDFIAGTVDFAGSDAVMTEQQVSDLARQRGGVTPLYFPTVLGAITVPTNVAGAGRLKLDGKVIGEIFAGTITKWNDRKITALNRGKNLPNADITVCVRADGSGTSFGFTLYLDKTSTVFRSRVGGASQQPDWKAPKLVKQPGNTGVAQCVKDNANSIGYVDLGDAVRAGLSGQVAAIGKFERRTVTQRVRRGGKVVRVKRTRAVEVFSIPTTRGISAAGNLRSFPLDNPLKLQRDLVNSSAPGAYPITITTFILAYSNYATAGKAGSLGDVRGFLNYAYGTGQGRVTPLGFSPLPTPMLNAAKRQLATLR